MKCNSCGYDNLSNPSNCEKCGATLSKYVQPSRSTVGDNQHRNSPVPADSDRSASAKTVRDLDLKECSTCGYKLRPDSSVCPSCGSALVGKQEAPAGKRDTPVSKRDTPASINCPRCKHSCTAGASFCSNCGYEMQQATDNTAGNRQKTIRPGEFIPLNTCRLKAIPNDNESLQNDTLTFAGDQVMLNRANTEESNLTITSKEQAVLTCEDGKWYIQDRSDYKTTFIHTAERIELKPGDIIMLGNRRFVFETDRKR